MKFKIEDVNKKSKVVHHDRLLPVIRKIDHKHPSKILDDASNQEELESQTEFSSDTSSSSKSDFEAENDDSADSEEERIEMRCETLSEVQKTGKSFTWIYSLGSFNCVINSNNYISLCCSLFC